MATPKSNHTIAVLNPPKAIPQFIVFSKGILAALIAAKVTFPSPTPPLSQLSADIDTLDKAETACEAKTKGLTAARNDAYKVVKADLHQIVAYVQQVANLSPDTAATIIASAGLGVKKLGSQAKKDLTVTSAESGAVHAVAKATTGGKSYEWQYSVDAGKTWVSVTPTTQSKTTITGLTSGVVTQFRHRAVTKAGPTEWSQPFALLVS